MKAFFSRNNRAITIVCALAVLSLVVFRQKDVAKGILLGGLLAVFYLDRMRVELAGLLGQGRPQRIRGRLFAGFGLRYILLAAGLLAAYLISKVTFWTATGSFVGTYLILMIMLILSQRVAKHPTTGAAVDKSDSDSFKEGASQDR